MAKAKSKKGYICVHRVDGNPPGSPIEVEGELADKLLARGVIREAIDEKTAPAAKAPTEGESKAADADGE